MKRKTIPVHCDSMRKVIHQNPDITFIKMDIEGSEMDILESVDEWYNENIKKLAGRMVKNLTKENNLGNFLK